VLGDGLGHGLAVAQPAAAAKGSGYSKAAKEYVAAANRLCDQAKGLKNMAAADAGAKAAWAKVYKSCVTFWNTRRFAASSTITWSPEEACLGIGRTEARKGKKPG